LGSIAEDNLFVNDYVTQIMIQQLLKLAIALIMGKHDQAKASAEGF